VATSNLDIAAAFEEIADLLEIEGENPFRVRAYRNAARTLRGMRDQAADLLARGDDLSRLPGIGTDLAAKIRDLVETGSTPLLDRLHKQFPPSLVEMLRLPGLGPKRVGALYHKLGIKTVAALQAAARSGKLAELPGFGPKLTAQIAGEAKTEVAPGRRFLLAEAATEAEPLVAMLAKVTGVKRVAIAGSYRRGRETVGDVDILVTAAAKSPVADRFVAYGRVERVLAHGPTRAAVVLRGGLQVDVRVVANESYGAALHYFTGAKAHNIAIRRLGQRRGLKINEYGVFEGETRVAGATEESVFKSVGLPFIPPELREDRGEIDAARAGQLPELVEAGDLRGDLYCHRPPGDGKGGLAALAAAARKAGLTYLAITEPAGGAGAKALATRAAAIERANAGLKGITLLKGIAVEIGEDGRLDAPAEALGAFDLVIGAVRRGFELPPARQLDRLKRAIASPRFTILAHPTGRLIGTREPLAIDMGKLVDAARDRGCFLELDARPDRLDLPDVFCHAAKAAGVLVAISSHAREPRDFACLRYGVLQARRGWLSKADVLNGRPLAQLKPLLARTMS
jgi:DNA polymerase (family 10)